MTFGIWNAHSQTRLEVFRQVTVARVLGRWHLNHRLSFRVAVTHYSHECFHASVLQHCNGKELHLHSEDELLHVADLEQVSLLLGWMLEVCRWQFPCSVKNPSWWEPWSVWGEGWSKMICKSLTSANGSNDPTNSVKALKEGAKD